MAINITKLLAAINTKVTAADSSQSIIELNRLAAAATLANDVKHARIFTALTDLPTADSTNVGDIVRVGATLDSASTKYYLSHNDKWKLITLQDSSTISQGGGGYSFQGSNYGYISGGFPDVNNISKFSLTSDGNATDVADLTVARSAAAGQTSSTHGYTSGGGIPTVTNVIDKFEFGADTNATDVGDLLAVQRYIAGQSSSTDGYVSGGLVPAASNVIQKFSFSTDGNSTDVGDLTVARSSQGAGQSSSVSGYTSGGNPTTNVIDKFPFASDANATDVGDLTASRYHAAGQSSTDNGYNAGGFPGPSGTNVIDKFSFASDGNATDVGDLTQAGYGGSGQSSTTHGYTSNRAPSYNIIDKFSFSSDGNATDVGDTIGYKAYTAGTQY